MATSRRRSRAGTPALLVGTAKGAFVLEGEASRRRWRLAGPFHFGSRVHDVRLDARDGRTLLATSTGGHLGPTIFVSGNRGRTWREARRPPQFGRARGRADRTSRGQSVQANFWLTPGHASDSGAWYCGTSPQGLFRSADGGMTWSGVRGFNEGPCWHDWTGGGENRTPDGAFLHSICVDPRDRRHLYLSLSIGGTFESRDAGRGWRPLNRGVQMDFMPDPDADFGHDPHCMIQHPADPDRLYQQNHCGIYRLDRAAADTWTRIGRRMPRRIGDIGFPIVGHPADPDTVWVFPMDGTRIWPRTSPDGKPAVYRTRNGGGRWERLDGGLPSENAWFTVMRQAMTADEDARRTGVYFGTTSGEIWASLDGAESWKRIAQHLPRIYSVRAATFR